jgi:hypothetical protein
MSRLVQDIMVADYAGPQGNFELNTVESATLNRTKSKSRVKTMNRQRRAIAFQTGTPEVTLTLTVVPELANTEVNWVQSWNLDEEFTMTIEKGLGGVREQVQDCQVSDVNDTFNENGEARQEVTIEGLLPIEEPA